VHDPLVLHPSPTFSGLPSAKRGKVEHQQRGDPERYTVQHPISQRGDRMAERFRFGSIAKPGQVCHHRGYGCAERGADANDRTGCEQLQ
jgi:hypothetical protein